MKFIEVKMISICCFEFVRRYQLKLLVMITSISRSEWMFYSENVVRRRLVTCDLARDIVVKDFWILSVFMKILYGSVVKDGDLIWEWL